MQDEKQSFIDGFQNGWGQAVKRMIDILLDVKTEIFNANNQTQVNNLAVTYLNEIKKKEGANGKKEN